MNYVNMKESVLAEPVQVVPAEASEVSPMTFARAEALTMYGILEGVVPTSWKKEVKKTQYDPKKNEKKSKEAEIVKEKGKPPDKPEKWFD